jgi:UDP-N-acetylmuramoyl-L-alanyl-D-glutamate--2,6-diaminopimelate ligase
MGEAAAKYADVVVITAEDPRTENLEKINDQILEGAKKSEGVLIKRFKTSNEYKEYNISPDQIAKKSIFIFDEERVQNRYDAIEFALKIAKPGDVIITEGKGHEQSLCFGTTEYPFTDQEAIKKSLKELESSQN